MRAEDYFHLRREIGEPLYGRDVSVEICFGAEEPDRAGIVGVAGEEQAVGAVDEADGVGRMAGCRNDFEGAAPEIDFEAVFNEERDVPWLGGVGFRVKTLWQIAADHSGRELFLGVVAGALCVLTREVCVHAVDKREKGIAADVIVVRVRVQDDDGTIGQLRDDFVDVGDAHAGVEEQRLLGADDEIGDDFFGLVRLVNGEDAGRDFVDFKPRVVRENAFERFVLWAGKSFAPIRAYCLWWLCEQPGLSGHDISCPYNGGGSGSRGKRRKKTYRRVDGEQSTQRTEKITSWVLSTRHFSPFVSCDSMRFEMPFAA